MGEVTELPETRGRVVEYVSADDVADAIVARLACNELSPEVGAYIRDLARGGGFYWTATLFGGAFPLLLDAQANPDGSLCLRLHDSSHLMIWQTTLRPAG